jgi:hypothetical protein
MLKLFVPRDSSAVPHSGILSKTDYSGAGFSPPRPEPLDLSNQSVKTRTKET